MMRCHVILIALQPCPLPQALKMSLMPTISLIPFKDHVSWINFVLVASMERNSFRAVRTCPMLSGPSLPAFCAVLGKSRLPSPNPDAVAAGCWWPARFLRLTPHSPSSPVPPEQSGTVMDLFWVNTTQTLSPGFFRCAPFRVLTPTSRCRLLSCLTAPMTTPMTVAKPGQSDGGLKPGVMWRKIVLPCMTPGFCGDPQPRGLGRTAPYTCLLRPPGPAQAGFPFSSRKPFGGIAGQLPLQSPLR
jgi:hypothetical protein